MFSTDFLLYFRSLFYFLLFPSANSTGNLPLCSAHPGHTGIFYRFTIVLCKVQ
ncbi:hypothetical protein EVA_18574 [gut metagenome]|uniref:Uncharacterized protein n=1 Tax=gut metagenome TaxID=749906 RepID=J9FFV6_9ZZZZ